MKVGCKIIKDHLLLIIFEYVLGLLFDLTLL